MVYQSYLRVIHCSQECCLFQGLLILTNIDTTLLRRILRGPVFSGHPVSRGLSQGSRGSLPNTGLTVRADYGGNAAFVTKFIINATRVRSVYYN